MDPTLYRAAMGGKENEYKEEVLMRYSDQLELQITSNKNTVLHVAAQFGNQKCVEKILEKSPSLLRSLNINGETPLHVAARQGHYDIVEALIRSAEKLDQELGSGGAAAKEMLRATNKNKDTALHMAVQKVKDMETKIKGYTHLADDNWRVVKLLTQKDKEFTHLANNSEETPLFLAAERGHNDYISVILKNCTSPAYGGPGGKTALHVAAMTDWSPYTGIIEKLLERKPDLIKERDAYGWTPIHYAARYNNQYSVKCLLENDKSVTYITTNDEDDEKTALHIAATFGNVEAMKELLSHCPDCWEMVNSKGQNVLHMAVDMKEESTMEYMLEQSWIIHLINQKDNEGNTPLHLLATSFGDDYIMPKRWHYLYFHTSGDWEATNNNNMTPEDIRTQSREDSTFPVPYGFKRITASMDQDYIQKLKAYDREQKKLLPERKLKEVEQDKKRADTHLIVATLIATVTFAAGFTMPGGYDGNQGPEHGMPVLLKAAAFKVFVITNTIAVICSISSAFLYATASFYDYVERKQYHRHVTAFWLILIAMGAMVVAFITGTYAVLSHSLGIAIAAPACLIGCFSFFILIPEVKKLYDRYYIRADWWWFFK